eukprot:m.216327 g.216327  ORF g.216327 m.216327 type:complete len:540 (+) comp25646_c1_seq1:247-1866(+)
MGWDVALQPSAQSTGCDVTGICAGPIGAHLTTISSPFHHDLGVMTHDRSTAELCMVHHGAPHPPGLGVRDHSVDGHRAGHSPAMHLQCHHPRLWLRRSITVCSGMVALLGLATAQADPLLPGPTFGTGLAGIPICQQPRVVLNYTLSSGANHGVLHHFWVTGEQHVIDAVWVEYYIDGETTPSIAFQPAFMCGLAFPTAIPTTYLYNAGSACGKNAAVGGWYNTFPIPFAQSALVTIRNNAAGCSNGYVNVRGTENLPVVLPGGLPLPTTARLHLQRNPWAVRQPLEYINITSMPSGTRGMASSRGGLWRASPLGVLTLVVATSKDAGTSTASTPRRFLGWLLGLASKTTLIRGTTLVQTLASPMDSRLRLALQDCRCSTAQTRSNAFLRIDSTLQTRSCSTTAVRWFGGLAQRGSRGRPSAATLCHPRDLSRRLHPPPRLHPGPGTPRHRRRVRRIPHRRLSRPTGVPTARAMRFARTPPFGGAWRRGPARPTCGHGGPGPRAGGHLVRASRLRTHAAPGGRCASGRTGQSSRRSEPP